MRQIFIDIYYRYWKKWGWFGNYPDWATAEADCEGYSTAEIFEKVKSTTIKVRDGKSKPGINQELINWLEKIYATTGTLKVVDFGGALGSVYFHHKEMLTKFPNIIWCVVEQNDFVKIGKSEFETGVLKFEYSIQDAVKKYQPNAFLLSSVLMYIEKPFEIL